jgi:mRNA interferase MazF
MKRGDLIVVSAPGDYGKPRPAVLVQSNAFPPDYPSLIVCQVTTHIVDAYFQLTIEPRAENGLRERSQIMVDKPVALKRERVGKIIGALSPVEMARLDSILAVVMGLAD